MVFLIGYWKNVLGLLQDWIWIDIETYQSIAEPKMRQKAVFG